MLPQNLLLSITLLIAFSAQPTSSALSTVTAGKFYPGQMKVTTESVIGF